MRPALLATGSLALVAAAVVSFVIVPSQARFPDDVDVTKTYAGTLELAFVPEALVSGDPDAIFVRDAPVEVETHTRTVAVDGDLALVASGGVVTGPDGSVLQTSDNRYAIDRSSMLAAPAFPGEDGLPARAPGLVMGFPVGTEARDYTGWSDEIGKTVDLRYERTEIRAGMQTHVFTSSTSNEVVVDEDVLAVVPQALSKEAVVALAAELDLLPAMADQFGALVPLLPDPVPLGLVSSGDTTFWVHPQTGIVIDMERRESRAAYLDASVIPGVVPVADVWVWAYQPTDENILESVETAKDAGSRLTTFGTTLPLVLAALGIAAIAAAFAGGRRRGRLDADDDPHDLGSVEVADRQPQPLG